MELKSKEKFLINFSCCFSVAENFSTQKENDERGQQKARPINRISSLLSTCAFFRNHQSENVWEGQEKNSGKTLRREKKPIMRKSRKWKTLSSLFFPISRFTHFHPLNVSSKQNFWYYLFCFIVVDVSSFIVWWTSRKTFISHGLRWV